MTQLRIVSLITLAFALVFYFLPELDRWSLAPFFVYGEGFVFSTHPVVTTLYDFVPWLVVGSMAASALSWWYGRIPGKALVYLLLVLVLGPGLLVNIVLKDQWGRARPYHVEHAQVKNFSPAWVMSDQCEDNCSFVSGHASVGFFLMSVGVVMRRNRRLWITGGMLAGLAIGLGRMAQGSHYLSDVLFAGLLVYMVALMVHAVMYKSCGGGGSAAIRFAALLAFRGRQRAGA